MIDWPTVEYCADGFNITFYSYFFHFYFKAVGQGLLLSSINERPAGPVGWLSFLKISKHKRNWANQPFWQETRQRK